MKISGIKQQLKQTDRYSIFVEGKYAFSLSESALLSSGLATGAELTKEQVNDFKRLSNEDKLYNRTLRYVALRPRSRWEVAFYLERKQASPALIEDILNKLSKLKFIDDETFAKTYVADRQLLRPASRRKMILDLKKKRVAEEIIQKVTELDDHDALQAVIERKRRQPKYQDDLKLMQYLARQGFNYQDIKAALADQD